MFAGTLGRGDDRSCEGPGKALQAGTLTGTAVEPMPSMRACACARRRFRGDPLVARGNGSTCSAPGVDRALGPQPASAAAPSRSNHRLSSDIRLIVTVDDTE